MVCYKWEQNTDFAKPHWNLYQWEVLKVLQTISY